MKCPLDIQWNIKHLRIFRLSGVLKIFLLSKILLISSSTFSKSPLSMRENINSETWRKCKGCHTLGIYWTTLKGIVMNLSQAITYTKQYRRHGKSCYIHSKNRYNKTFYTNQGMIKFICVKCHYHHGGKSKWWRAYLTFENNKPIPTTMFHNIVELE